MSECNSLYAISFTVGAESGIALVAASNEGQAMEVLRNSGNRACAEPGYTLIQIRNIGMSTSCVYGLLLESYVNALQAYDAIVSVADHFIKGDKGDSVWVNMYVDDEFYLHVVEDLFSLSSHLSFDASTGYLTIT